MSRQRTDRAVLTEAQQRAATEAKLRAVLRKNGIRSTHSKRAREAIERACLAAVAQAILPSSTPKIHRATGRGER